MLDRIFEELWDFYGIPRAASAAVFSFLAAALAVCGIISFALYIVRAVGISKMARRVGINNGWLAFVPIAGNYIFGRIAEKYIRKDRRQSGKFGIILTVLNSFLLLCGICLVFAALKMTGALINDTSDSAMSIIGINVFFICAAAFLVCGLALAYMIVRFVALWRIYAIFNYQNASMFTVLTYFFSFLEPILIFISRNKEPKYDYNARIGFNFNDF